MPQTCSTFLTQQNSTSKIFVNFNYAHFFAAEASANSIAIKFHFKSAANTIELTNWQFNFSGWANFFCISKMGREISDLCHWWRSAISEILSIFENLQMSLLWEWLTFIKRASFIDNNLQSTHFFHRMFNALMPCP